MWNSALWEKFNFYFFQQFFSIIDRTFISGVRLGTTLLFNNVFWNFSLYFLMLLCVTLLPQGLKFSVNQLVFYVLLLWNLTIAYVRFIGTGPVFFFFFFLCGHIEVVLQLVSKLVYTMIITNNCASFHLRWKKKKVKH